MEFLETALKGSNGVFVDARGHSDGASDLRGHSDGDT